MITGGTSLAPAALRRLRVEAFWRGVRHGLACAPLWRFLARRGIIEMRASAWWSDDRIRERVLAETYRARRRATTSR